MMDILQCVDFLKRLHIFRNLDDSQLTEVAEALVEVSYEPGQQIVRQGEKGDKFFIITAGSVDVLRGAREKQRRLAALVRGDYFGEEALLAHGARNATVQALEATRLMELTHNDFHALLKKIPKLRTNIEVAVASHRLARTRRFDWIQDGEVIYFIARKHPIVLWRSLLGPFFTLVLPSGLLAAFIASANPLLLYASGVALLGVGLWTLYNVIDWTNDYYIVTNRRAIWLEKVIGLYDSRQEAPLSTVLSVGVETDQVGRILDYGTVNIRTFVGRIIFNHVHRPYQAASLVEEHWTRTREGARQADS
ncbi:MAG: cyclic nucleotide-binding domain-containing protein, partial [Chloroflexi bacterium]|nr:cyclic nucleotide-binding domain-containing protein [Chloroflexota bacterium]